MATLHEATHGWARIGRRGDDGTRSVRLRKNGQGPAGAAGMAGRGRGRIGEAGLGMVRLDGAWMFSVWTGTAGNFNAKGESMKQKSILDPTFHYVSAAQTDLRKTFARIRREQAKAKEAAVPVPITVTAPACRATLNNVRPLAKKAKA